MLATSFYRVKQVHNDLHERPLMSMFKPKYFRYSLFAQTWKPMVVFLVLFYIMLIFYDKLPTKLDCKLYNSDPNVKLNHTSIVSSHEAVKTG